MKVSLKLGPGGPMTRDKAKVCFVTNLGFPGAGSLMGGKIVGYPQLLMTVCGLGISMICGGKFLTWFFANWSRLQNPSGDPLEILAEIWQAVKWPLAGLGLFALAWLWGFVTGWSLLVRAKRAEAMQSSKFQAPS